MARRLASSETQGLKGFCDHRLRKIVSGEVLSSPYPVRVRDYVSQFAGLCESNDVWVAVIDRPGLLDPVLAECFGFLFSENLSAFEEFDVNNGLCLQASELPLLLPMAICARAIFADLIAFCPEKQLHFDVDHDYGVFIYDTAPPGLSGQ